MDAKEDNKIEIINNYIPGVCQNSVEINYLILRKNCLYCQYYNEINGNVQVQADATKATEQTQQPTPSAPEAQKPEPVIAQATSTPPVASELSPEAAEAPKPEVAQAAKPEVAKPKAPAPATLLVAVSCSNEDRGLSMNVL